MYMYNTMCVCRLTVFIAHRGMSSSPPSLPLQSLVPDAEVMYVVSELVSELPSLQESVCSVCVSHTSLLTALLTHCSIPTETHPTVMSILSRSMLVGSWSHSAGICIYYSSV